MLLLERIGCHIRYESLSKMMKKRSRWREVICLHQCLNELPIREFKKIKLNRNFIRTRTRCTVLPLKTNSHKHGLIMADLSSRNLWEKQVQTLNFATCQRTSAAFSSAIWVDSTGRVNSENHRTWTSLLPKVKSSMSPICHYSENSGRNKYAYVFLTAEAGSLSTDAKQLLEDYGLVRRHSSRSNNLSVHARIDCTGCVRLLWESSEEDDKNSHAALFEVRFVKKKAKGVK